MQFDAVARGREAALRWVDEDGAVGGRDRAVPGELLDCTALRGDEAELVVYNSSVAVQIGGWAGAEGGTEVVVGVGALGIIDHCVDSDDGGHGSEKS